MFARDRRTCRWAAAATLAALAAPSAHGQQARQAAPPAEKPTLVRTEIPTNPSDPIAIINGTPITRGQLANECIVRKGEEILETLIARTLIDQEIEKKGLAVTPAEIDAEIDAIAHRMAGVSREGWLRTLQKNRGISPSQYARDIIYPSIALRKLAEPRVQVTDENLREAFAAQYGEKLKARMIMVDKLQTAQQIWEELRKNPAGFEKLAMEKSMDLNTRSLGGEIAEPICRYAVPRTVSDAAFAQLVDGDPADKNPDHKPKDGDFTGPIQASETSWIILKRDKVIPAQAKDASDPAIAANLKELVKEALLKEKMGEVFNEMVKNAEINNILTGKSKIANEESQPESQLDSTVVQTKGLNTPSTPPANGEAAAAPGVAAGKAKLPTPAALSPDAVKQTKKLQESVEKRREALEQEQQKLQLQQKAAKP